MTILTISKTIILYNLLPITYIIQTLRKNKKTGKCAVKVTIALNADEDDNLKVQSSIAKSGLPLLGEPLYRYWGVANHQQSQRELSKQIYADTYEEAFEQADKSVLKELEDIDNWIRDKSNEGRSK